MKVLVIDSHNMIHRARYGFKFGNDPVTFGFFRCLKSEIDRHSPDLVYVVTEGRPQFRYEIFPDYKGNRVRKPDNSFERQKNDIFKLCKFLPVILVRHPDYECDDSISLITRNIHPEDDVVICSSDSDFIQLLDRDNVFLWNPIKKKFVDPYPVDYVTWKALSGDSSDNIPGMPGVGAKTALKLAADENLLEAFFTKKPECRKDFEDFKNIIKFYDIDLDDENLELSFYNFNEVDLFESFNDRSFNSIVGKGWNSWKTTMEKLNENTRLSERRKRAN